ncbi:tolloid-like protein 2 [Amphiura filiformis]|uniref:tolloid-like protein 2 n=1 Tax=Amphiura filiformis TaxID=82378 RepID=UPI003B20F86D
MYVYAGLDSIKMLSKIITILLVIPSLTISQITDVILSESGAVSILGLSGDEEAAICYQGTNGNWSSVEASVTCRHLEYLDGEAVVLTEEDIAFLPEVVIFDFECYGGELSLAECRYGDATTTDVGCGSKLYAGANCSSTNCGGTFNSFSGTISSPNYPNRYPVYASCDYIISVPTATAINITFHSFDVEYEYDYLVFGVGTNPETSSPSDSLTGSIVPDPFILGSGTMWFRFFSDSSLNNYGFLLTWEAFDLPLCSYRYTSTTGSITSTNYPNEYPAFTNCTYILDIPDVEHIAITFHDFKLEYRHDFLYYGVGTVPSIEHSLLAFTGSRISDSFGIPSSAAWFIFISDGSINYQGFNFTWDTSTEAPETQITDVSITADGSGVEVATGIVRVQGLTDSGSSWAHICYTGNNGDWSDIEAKLICRYHGFGDGEATSIAIDPESSWVLHNFQCGAEVTSLNNCTWDLMHDPNGCGDKFNAGVRCINDPCDAVFTTTSGSIQSPNFPSLYPPLSNCTYHINVPGAARLLMTFEQFRTEHTHDTLRFYRNNPATTTDTDHVGTLSGWGDQAPLEFYTDSLWLLFTSDRSIEYTGFNLTWVTSGKYLLIEYLLLVVVVVIVVVTVSCTTILGMPQTLKISDVPLYYVALDAYA